MGPFVPDIIGNELNLIVAIILGIGFGFVLEQAGFSTSKKLVGLFYGYDFTVLRVFFTAGVTAMLGVVALVHFGLLDMSLVYVNPTFLWGAVVGGLIMGLGFVIGGFCPGTSVCAAAIGKIDAMIFIVGSFLGVLVFAEGYPWFEHLYKAESWGSPTIFETLHISQAMFAFLLTFVAVGAFWAVTMIENRVNKRPNPKLKAIPIYVALTGIAVIIGLSAFVMPDRKEALLQKVSDNKFIAAHQVEIMTSDELAFRIIDDEQELQIFDLRTTDEFSKLSLPKSKNIKLQDLFDKETGKLLNIKHKKNVFLANDDSEARRAAVLAGELGYGNVFVLQGGLNQFRTYILDYKASEQPIGSRKSDTERFRIKASKLLPELIEKNKQANSQQGEKKTKRVVGGC